MPEFEIVASAENNAYMEWQAMLFHYSCVTFQRQVPIIMVHKGNEPLRPGFELIIARGGNVQPTTNERNRYDVVYPPRNSAVALQTVRTDAEFVVLCDADMIFLKPLPPESLRLAGRTISFDRIGFLNPDNPVYQPDIDDVFRANGIDPAVLRNPVIDGAVPHVVPAELRAALGEEWLRCMDLFPILFEGERPDVTHKRYADWPYRCYLASMWAIIMAKHKLALEHVETHLSMTNFHGGERLPAESESSACLLHYAYGTPGFNKRSFRGDRDVTDLEMWNTAEDDGTVDGQLRRQARDAGRFFGLC